MITGVALELEHHDGLLAELLYEFALSPLSSISCALLVCLLALIVVLVLVIRAVDWLQLNHGDVFVDERGGCRFFHPQRG